MYSLIALIAGIAAKLYDDLDDNMLLQKYRNSTLMEFLKGIHYITFISLSIEEPMFFIIQYLCNIVHHFGNKEAYSKPYEKSLLYSFLLLFVIIDYKKITSFCLSDKLISIFYVFTGAIEPFMGSDSIDEYSFAKMIARLISMIIHIILYYFIRSNSLKYFTAYFIGYIFISVLVQCYSLRVEKLEAKEEEAKEEAKEETKEDTKEETKEEEETKRKKEAKEEEAKEETKEETKEEEASEEEATEEETKKEEETKEEEIK